MDTTFSTTFAQEDKELIREDALHNVVALQEEEGTDNNQVYISTSLGVVGFVFVVQAPSIIQSAVVLIVFLHEVWAIIIPEELHPIAPPP
jgi:hypothetical protein